MEPWQVSFADRPDSDPRQMNPDHSTTATDWTDHDHSREHVDDRYSPVELADGDLLVYDHERPRAWLQSDAPVSLDDRA